MTNIVGVLGFAVCLVVIYVMPANMMIVTVLLGIVITSVLSAVGYHADAAITSSTVSGIKILCLVVPIIFLVVSIIPLLGYKIKDSDIAIMEKELQERESLN